MLTFAITGCSIFIDYVRWIALGMSPVFHEGYAKGYDGRLDAIR